MFDDLKKDQASQPQNSSAQMLKKIDDMFADVDPAPQPKPMPSPTPMPAMERPSAIQSGKMKPISPNQNINIPVAPQNTQASFAGSLPQAGEPVNVMTTSRKLVIIFSVLILLIIVGGIVYYFFFKNRPQNTEDLNQNQNINVSVNENQNINNNQNINSNQNSNINDSVIVDEETLDDDFDGLTNAEEIEIGTNPYESDTDNDGVFDQDEVEVYHTDPLLDDSDSDELGDFEEVITYGTDPNNPDSDDDGYMDGTEVLNGYNPKGSGLLEDMEPLPPKNTNTNENNQ